MSKGIDLYEKVCELSSKVSSSYRDNIAGRNTLIDFMDANQWFGEDHAFCKNTVFVEYTEAMESALCLWLSAYGKSKEEKIQIMIQAYHDQLPDTCDRFMDFIRHKNYAELDVTWKVLDFLLYYLEKDLKQMSDTEVESLIQKANAELTLTGMQFLEELLHWPYMGHKVTEWRFQFYSRQIEKQDNDAYTLNQFSVMAYIIFNEDSWKKNQLIKKAASSRKDADLWLFSALHFVCALRKTDIERLPIPALPDYGEKLRSRIVDGDFTKEEVRQIAYEVMYRAKMKTRKPHKTRKSKAVSSIKVFFPESTLEPLGIMMALSLSYREDGDPFVSCQVDLTRIRRLFGEEFAQALGNKVFRSRRANKAYMQGLEAVAEENAETPKGYMLAAIARSHAGGIGALPEMTDIYLKDENFTGYKPEFILREMFERGIFGFVPVLLLEKCMGNEFHQLSVTAQTAVIKELGLIPEQLETLTHRIMISKKKGAELVDAAVKGLGVEEINATLQKIASGAAPGKQENCLCLMNAVGIICQSPDRCSCIGCGYEVYTKSALHMLMREYVQINERRRKAIPFEKQRLTNILNEAIMPAVIQAIETFPILYPEAELEPMYQIIERGIQHAAIT